MPETTPTLLAEQVIADLRARANPDNVAGMARFGISPVGTLGVPVPVMRSMAKDARKALGKDEPAWHELAAALWASGVHEARIMASFVDAARFVDGEQMEAWASAFDSWDTCDQVCANLFRQAAPAWEKMVAWASRDEEFVKRAGFVLGATLAVHEKRRDDADFVPLLALAESAATDERNFVKKAVNWQIRQIGKRSAPLNAEAIAACERILAAGSGSKAARWIARDALRELTSDAVRGRLGLL